MHYISDRDLYRELVISKGKGKLTPKCQEYLLLVCKKVSNKFNKRLAEHMREDVYQFGVCKVLENWNKFDPNRFDQSLPYITEVYKRGSVFGYNILCGIKAAYETPKFIHFTTKNGSDIML